jgi:diguanylate cyclase (GGDEF)-like protein
VVESDATLERTLRAADGNARDRRQRLRWTYSTAASYALDALFLGAFVALGTVPASVLGVFALGAALICCGAYAAYSGGWNLRWHDPNMIEPQVVAGVAVHLAVVALAPQVMFPAITNLFTVFAFGFLWLPVRGALALWAFGVAAAGAVFALVGARAAAATATPAEAWLSWLNFSAVLARCLLLSGYGNALRSRVTESRRRLSETLDEVQRLASHDELTRALNRRALMASLDRERARAERSGVPFSIGMMDLDHFKSVNDEHGHAAGDEVLRGFAATAHETMRVTDVFGRYGGEEFLIVLVGTGLPEAIEALERIRAALQKRAWDGVAPGLVQTVSAGVASFRKGETVEQLLHRADQALYEAKNGGRNRVVASKP